MLEKVFISNYLSLVSEQELKVSNRITALIGGNATGKTSVLKAIEKLNGEKIEIKEKNINFEEKETNISAKFKLKIDKLKKLNEEYQNQCKDSFILFPIDSDLIYYLSVEEDGSLTYSLKDLEGNDIDLLMLAIPNIVKFFDIELNKIDNETISLKVIGLLSDVSAIRNILNALTPDDKRILGFDILKKLEQLVKEINSFEKELLPNYKFIYMNSFKDVLIDSISLDSINSNKTVLNFLEIANISKEEIIDAVNSENQQKIRTIENKTVSIVTEHFKKIFSQVKDDEFFKISMTIDNKNRKLNFWIQNKITGEAVLPFSSESEGMQWYLSMYLRLYEYFNNISINTEYILLLDEPNIYLHAEAQYDLLNNVFKDKLSDVQIIYSTHSPYMIDAADLFSLRVIDKDCETKIFNTTIDYLKFRKREENLEDIDVLSPVLMASGINISNQLTISPTDNIVVVVEGPHDYYMLSAMKEILKIKDKNLKFIPCQGASKVSYMCGYLYGLGYNVIAVMDDDVDGRSCVESLKYENEDLKFIHAILYSKDGVSGKDCLLEDLFSEKDRCLYMKEKSTINYRCIYDSRSTIQFEQETKDNFKRIFDELSVLFDSE